MSDIDYIKVSATVRQIQETVLHRANDNGIKLSTDTVRNILQTAIELAFIAHDKKDTGRASVLSGSSTKGTPDEPQDPSIGDDWDYQPRSAISR